jgi:dihydrofolate reductase
MNTPKISLIVAISKNRAIGKDNKLIWYIPEDLKRFRQITAGHVVIMGKKTYQSIGKPLPNRTNIIITRDKKYQQLGCIIAYSVDEALYKARSLERQEIFVIGGGQIFEQTIHFADKLYLTIIDQEVSDADTFFPSYPQFTKVVHEEQREHNGLTFTWLELEKPN